MKQNYSLSGQLLNTITSKQTSLFTLFAFIILLSFSSFNSKASNVTSYTYAESIVATYTPLSGGTTLCTGNGAGTFSTNYTLQTIGFPFSFNCTTYQLLGVNTDGYIWFGNGTPSAQAVNILSNASPSLGGSAPVDGIVAAYAGTTSTLVAADASAYIRTILSGTSPNRIFKIEYSGYKVTGGDGGAGLPAYQLWLYETSNVIEEHVADMSALFIQNNVRAQIGLRGANAADVQCLSTPVGTNNTTWDIPTSVTLNTSTVAVDGALGGDNIYCGVNRVFTWTPVSCCTIPTTQASGATLGAVTNTSQVINWTSAGGGNGGALVVVRPATAAKVDPLSGSTYTANAAYPSAQAVGLNNFAVYSGTGTTVTVTGLSSHTAYKYTIYTFNTPGPCYMTATPDSGTFTTTNTGIQDASKNLLPVVYPNPSNGDINVIIGNNYKNEVTLTIVDTQGRLVYSEMINVGTLTNNTKSIKLSSKYGKGIYFITLSDEHYTGTSKFVLM